MRGPCHNPGMARSPSYPFLIRQGRTFHARLDVPADVQAAFGGKKVFSRSTKLSDPEEAFNRARPWLDQWRAEIEAAREGRTGGAGASSTPADALARQFAAETGHQHIMLIREVVEFVAKRLTPWSGVSGSSGLSDDQWQDAVLAKDCDPLAALAMAGGFDATQAVRDLTKPCTPLAARLAEFRAAYQMRLAPKVLYEYCNEVEKFATGVKGSISVESFASADVQAFIDARAKLVSIVTIKKQVSALRTYWTWMAGHEPALRSRRPFDGIAWPKPVHKRSDPTQADYTVDEDHEDGPRFTPEQVCALWEAADANGDTDLRDAIVIAAYTGARRESIFSLHRKTTALSDKLPHLHLHDKTEAGRRVVPAHPDIVPILTRRFAAPMHDGYLFRGGDNKVASRSARLTNPLRKLLTEHGFGKGYGFHSFRRTFVDFLQQSSVAELHAARIVGHGIKTITYGLYAGKLPLQQSMDILVATVRYPRPPAY